MAREDLHFRLRISESLKRRVRAAGAANSRSMTAEIIARLEASFLIEDLANASQADDDDMAAMLADIDNLKQRLVRYSQRIDKSQ